MEDSPRYEPLKVIDTRDKTVEKLIERIQARSNEGLKEYGKPISDNKKNVLEWLREAGEEHNDAAVYYERALEENLDPIIRKRIEMMLELSLDLLLLNETVSKYL